MTDRLNVDPKVLQQAATGIGEIIGELSDLGVKESGAVGRGFALLTLSSLEAGKEPVQKGFEGYTERWSWGVRYLVQGANSIASTLGLAGGRYHMMDRQAQGMFKEMYTHMLGNPHMSSADIRQRSWSQTLSDNPFNHLRNPDYSAKSFTDAAQHVNRNWQVVKTVGPQALANANVVNAVLNPLMTPVAADPAGVLPSPGWNTGASETATKILQQPQEQG
ncbi:hypothetical protein [Nocardia sp. NPDC048505]|uniref:hypothetical protein n=1 Tax=unclassified Nocardia TaxID=2637762 RepID=UPI0033DC8683